MTAQEREFSVVGRSVPRVEAVAKATGTARYIADLEFPGALQITLLRSHDGHGRIVRLDVDQALAVPGVKGVLTGADFTELIGECILDQPPLARGKVRHAGEPVAAVIAESRDVGRLAVERIELELEPLPVLLDPREAAAPGAPLVHEDADSYERLPIYHPVPGTNIYHHYRLRRGDVRAALAQADVVLEGEYHFPLMAHAMLEPHGCVARWSREGQLTVWSCTQAPHIVKSLLAHLLGLRENRVRVIVPWIGGGFGGKSDYTIEPLVALIARRFPDRHVRLILEREEVFAGTVVGRGFRMRIRLGATADGRFLAEEAELLLQGGAYASNSVNIVEGAGHNATGPYDFPNVSIDAKGVYTNTPPVGAFRGYGHPEVHWMMERHIDRLAERLALDPVALRRRNLIRPGAINAFGQRIEAHHGNIPACIDAVQEALASSGPAPETRRSGGPILRGRGIALLMKSPVMATHAASCAFIKANADGTFHVSVSGIDIGQGSTTALSQIAAESLQVPLEAVKLVQQIDTDLCPWEWQTVASSSTWKIGNAIQAAAEQVIERLKENAAHALGIPVERVGYAAGEAFDTEAPERRVPLRRIAICHVAEDGRARGAPVMGVGAYLPRGLTYADPETGQGNLAAEWTFGCQGAEVEVDTRTGRVRVLHLVTALDAGRIINPALARNQVIGAMVQGLGGALLERLVFDHRGRLRNDSFVDYKIPYPEDMPEKLTVIFIDTPAEDTPYGLRPLAEHGIVSVAPAIANAIHAACGLDFDRLPMNQDRVLEALQQALETRGAAR